MPYCPKCDMEFVDGITTCTDCKGPLLESYEAAQAIKQPQTEEGYHPYPQDYSNTPDHSPEDNGPDEQPQAPPEAPMRPKLYIRKSQQYEDLKSSGAAFLLVSTGLLIFSLLCWLNIISLPMEHIPKLLFQTILTIMGAVFLAVSFNSSRTARNMTTAIAEEDRRTANLIKWFTSLYTGKTLDTRLTTEFEDLLPEELSLKRLELIQDILITSNDIPDPTYAEELSEEIYIKLYETK